MTTQVREVLDMITILHALRKFYPRWALWRDGTGEWTATRPGSDGALVWHRANDPVSLARAMNDTIDERQQPDGAGANGQ